MFYDLGANVGYFTLVAARLVGGVGHVYAFEPSPRPAAALRRNIALNGFDNVTVVERAVADSNGLVRFDTKAREGDSHLEARVAHDGDIEVHSTSIDAFVRSGARPPTAMKIDVEGYETEAIAGSVATITEHRPRIVCEIHQTRHVNEHPVERIMKECGLRVRWLEPGMSREATWWVPHVVGEPS